MKPRAPAASAAPIVARSCVAESTTIGRRGKLRRSSARRSSPCAPGQREVEQHQRAIRVTRKQRERLVAIHGGQDAEVGLEVGQHLRERMHDQRMIVDDEYLPA